MSSPKLFGVYTAQFPFLDANQAKLRPIIVISKPQGKHSVVATIPISSKAKPEAVDVTLSGWKDAGLIKPSAARVHRLTTMLQADLLAEFGTLQPGDIKTLQSSLRKFLEL